MSIWMIFTYLLLFSNNGTSITWPLLWDLILLKVWDMERLVRWQKWLVQDYGCLAAILTNFQKLLYNILIYPKG